MPLLTTKGDGHGPDAHALRGRIEGRNGLLAPGHHHF